MRTKYPEKQPNSEKSEHNIDEAVEDTFSASDPPSIGGVAKIRPESDQKKSHGNASTDAEAPTATTLLAKPGTGSRGG